MKKLFAFLLIAAIGLCVSKSVKAQAIDDRAYTTSITKTITAPDTITYTSIRSGVVMFEYNYTETSGTTAGKLYLEGKFLNSWVKLDSVSLSDVATVQTLRHIPTQTSYLSYRLINTNTSSSTGTVIAGYLRRPGVK